MAELNDTERMIASAVISHLPESADALKGAMFAVTMNYLMATAGATIDQTMHLFGLINVRLVELIPEPDLTDTIDSALDAMMDANRIAAETLGR